MSTSSVNFRTTRSLTFRSAVAPPLTALPTVRSGSGASTRLENERGAWDRATRMRLQRRKGSPNEAKGAQAGSGGAGQVRQGWREASPSSLRTFGRRTRECNRPTYAAADADLQRDY